MKRSGAVREKNVKNAQNGGPRDHIGEMPAAMPFIALRVRAQNG